MTANCVPEGSGLLFCKSTEATAQQPSEPFNPFQLFSEVFVLKVLVVSRSLGPSVKFLCAHLARYVRCDGRVYPSVCDSIQKCSSAVSFLPASMVSRAGLEPVRLTDKVIDRTNSKNAKIAASADLRYTAGTRNTNSLVTEVRDEYPPLRLLCPSVHRQ